MKKRRTKLSIFIFLALAILVVPEVQSVNPRKHYFRFEGKINEIGYIEMNLVKINDSVYGNYSLVSNDGNSTKFMETDSYKPVQLYGKINARGVYVIKENPWDEGASFTGKLVDGQTFKGSWESADGNMKYPFVLKERYPGGSLPFNVYFQKGSVPLTNKSNPPRATLQYCLLSPAESNYPVNSDSLTKMILSIYMGKPIRKVSPDMLLNAMKEIYFSNYITTNESIYKEVMGASFDWVSYKFMDIILNRSHLLTFYIEQYAFTGGAHGLQTRDYTVVNLITGRPVAINEIFSGDYESALTDILTKKVRKMHNIDADKKLTDNGFFVESVKPTNNFYLTVNGIGFFYNHYEIAPYSNGPDDIFIPFADLNTLLINDGILNGLPGYSLQP
jgi:hypothetical protein